MKDIFECTTEKNVDVAVIGAGVIGSAIARELTRYNLKVHIIEKSEDVCTGTSKANSAIIHGGFDAKVGTLKAKMNVEGNRMMDQISEELQVPFKRNGSMVLCFDEEQLPSLKELYQRGKANGVEGLEILTGAQAKEKEPSLNEDVCGALFCPTSGIVCPFELTLAYAENAVQNGASLSLNEEVLSIEKIGQSGDYLITTSEGKVKAKAVINAAGVFAEKIHDMLLPHMYTITPRKGEYCLFDKKVGGLTSSTLFQMPTKYGKGILVTPTVHGNLLIGPTAQDMEDKEDKSTSDKGLELVLSKASKSIKEVPRKYIITSFAGLRAHGDKGDFVLGQTDQAQAPGFFEAACIESPGLSSAPAIGCHMAKLVAEYLEAEKNPSFNPKRSHVQYAEDDAKRIICRCEKVSEGEIIGAIHRTIGATTIDGVKRRTRAGMGRCQGGFCMIKVMEILSRELNIPFEEIRKKGQGSAIVFGKTK